MKYITFIDGHVKDIVDKRESAFKLLKGTHGIKQRMDVEIDPGVCDLCRIS